MRLAYAFVFLMAPATASAQTFEWSSMVSDVDAALMLREQGTSNTPLWFWCRTEADGVVVRIQFTPDNAEEELDTTFTLKAENVMIPVNANGFTLPSNGRFVLEGRIAMIDDLVALIGRGETITIEAEGRMQSYSLEGASSAASPMLDLCWGP
jgi:hypothetical protein